MEQTFIDLVTTKGVVGVLIAVILGLIAFLKIVFDMYKQSEIDKNEMAKDVIGLVFKYEHKLDLDRIYDAEIIKRLDELQKTLYERNR
jgi:hypothetical protein